MKIAIVTGASRGIGRAISLRLAADGFGCLLAARTETDLVRVRDEIQSTGGTAAVFAHDLSEPEGPQALAQFALATFGRIDAVINNAGATRRGDFETLTDDDWLNGFALKLFGAVRLTRAAWPALRAAGGSVLNIAGIGGRTPGAEFSVGGSVNAAMLSWTKSLAETGLRDGVQVNAISPGTIRTDRFAVRLAKLASELNVSEAEAESAYVERERVVRVGEPGDIAGLAAWILSPQARFLHGALIDMDGGATKSM